MHPDPVVAAAGNRRAFPSAASAASVASAAVAALRWQAALSVQIFVGQSHLDAVVNAACFVIQFFGQKMSIELQQ
jgi:hypothetical protein